jgi:hypothetical protein
MSRNVQHTRSRTPRNSAALTAVSTSSRDSLVILFGFGGMAIVLLAILVLVILGAGCAGQFG